MTKCSMTNSVLAAILFAVVDYFIGYGVWSKLFADATLSHSFLFRAMETQEMQYGMPLGSFVVGLAIAYAYRKLKCSLKGDTPWQRGFQFGFLLWLIAGVGGSIQWYSYTPVSQDLLAASIIYSFLIYTIGTMVVARTLCGGTCSTTACAMPAPTPVAKPAAKKPATKKKKTTKKKPAARKAATKTAAKKKAAPKKKAAKRKTTRKR